MGHVAVGREDRPEDAVVRLPVVQHVDHIAARQGILGGPARRACDTDARARRGHCRDGTVEGEPAIDADLNLLLAAQEFQQLGAGLVAVDDHVVAGQIVGMLGHAAARHIIRRGHAGHAGRRQAACDQGAVRKVADAHAHIEALIHQIDHAVDHGQAHIHFRPFGHEIGNDRDQPPRAEIDRRRHPQQPGRRRARLGDALLQRIVFVEPGLDRLRCAAFGSYKGVG